MAVFAFKSQPFKFLSYICRCRKYMPINLLRKMFRKLKPNKLDLVALRSELQLLVAAHHVLRHKCATHEVAGIVFSMDRALQLHALLGSYVDLVARHPTLKIIYRASSGAHESAYQEVFREYSWLVEPKRQETRQAFKTLLMHALSESVAEHVFFLVDDNMFLEPVDLNSFASQSSMYSVPSLRMGPNLTRSYTLQRPQAVPEIRRIESFSDEPLLAWLWKSGELDWNYPLSVDGHVFQRSEILALAKTLDFDSPNRFEEQLQKFQPAFSWRLGLCYAKSRLINIPYNRVQTDIENLHGSVHQEDMLRMWNEGYRIDRKAYYGVVNESAHQEMPLRLKNQTEIGRN